MDLPQAVPRRFPLYDLIEDLKKSVEEDRTNKEMLRWHPHIVEFLKKRRPSRAILLQLQPHRFTVKSKKRVAFKD